MYESNTDWFRIVIIVLAELPAHASIAGSKSIASRPTTRLDPDPTATGAMKVRSKMSMSMVCNWDSMPLRYVCPHIKGATISEFGLLFMSVYLPTSCYRYVCITEGKASRDQR